MSKTPDESNIIIEQKRRILATGSQTGEKPSWTRHKFRAGLAELLSLEVITSPVKGRGKVRQYQLQERAVAVLSGAKVRLLSVGELAKVGETGFANFTPMQAIG